MPLLTIIPLPSIQTVISSSSEYSAPMFAELWPIAVYGIGISVGVLIIIALREWIVGGIRALTGRKDE